MKPSTLLMQLDADTRDLQVAVDARWLDLMSGSVTRDHYRRHLACTYGFEAPFESALAYTPNLLVPDRRERTRSGLIAQDLLALGMSAPNITKLPQCDGIGTFSSAAEALGWKYVLERPTQLHSAIKRNLLGRFPEMTDALSHLSATDGVAGARWQQLGMILDEVSARLNAAAAIIAAARTAFARMGAWYADFSG